MKCRHLAQFSGSIVSMPLDLAGRATSTALLLSLIATLVFYVVLLSFSMYVNFNYRVNENFVSHRTLLRKTCKPIYWGTPTQLSQSSATSKPHYFVLRLSISYFLLNTTWLEVRDLQKLNIFANWRTLTHIYAVSWMQHS